MLKKQNRLSTKFEFNVTRKHGIKKTYDYFHLFYLKPNNYEGSVKIGIVIPNKFHKNAVTRNRIKRVFRELIRGNIKKLPDNTWLVFHPKVESIKASHEKISTDINKALSEISLS